MPIGRRIGGCRSIFGGRREGWRLRVVVMAGRGNRSLGRVDGRCETGDVVNYAGYGPDLLASAVLFDCEGFPTLNERMGLHTTPTSSLHS
jgi:hypothetical protein